MSGASAAKRPGTRGRRQAQVLAFAKINLDLRVLHRRPDGFHELRTIFQTISLADRIQIAYTPSPKTGIRVSGNVEIPDNLLGRAAKLCLGAMHSTGAVELELDKRIPMGAGLGGGSSDAAAVLLALPVVAGKRLEMPELMRLGAELGSDVPFFLLGGRAVGVGRGTELYPLPDGPAQRGLLIAPELHVSTAEAYSRLSPQLTSESQENKMVSFQSKAWRASGGPAGWAESDAGHNDFEGVVFERHPQLDALKRRLQKLGAAPALMSGSGSAIFGLFSDREQVRRAVQSLREERVFPITLVSRSRYRLEWSKRLQSHTRGNLWPPQSRYAR